MFGMGTGGSPSPLPPEIVSSLGLRLCLLSRHTFLPTEILPPLLWTSGKPSAFSASWLSAPSVLHFSWSQFPLRAALSSLPYSRPLALPDNCTGIFFRLPSHSLPLPLLASASALVRLMRNQALDLLVSTTSIRYRTSSVDLSPDSLSGVLPAYAMGIFILR